MLTTTLTSFAAFIALTCIIVIPVWMLWRRTIAISNRPLLENRCPYCDYDTSGIADGAGFRRCPECGNSIPDFSDYVTRLDELRHIINQRDPRTRRPPHK